MPPQLHLGFDHTVLMILNSNDSDTYELWLEIFVYTGSNIKGHLNDMTWIDVRRDTPSTVARLMRYQNAKYVSSYAVSYRLLLLSSADYKSS